MRRIWKGLGWSGTFLLALLGCKPTETQVQPPPLREEYTLPPDEDLRFAQPPIFPREARRNGPARTPAFDAPGMPPPSMRPPGSPRVGGPGMGGL